MWLPTYTNMNVINKSEEVNFKTVEEAIEYARTALLQGYRAINIYVWKDSDKGIDVKITQNL